jgi:hypothetical protein
MRATISRAGIGCPLESDSARSAHAKRAAQRAPISLGLRHEARLVQLDREVVLHALEVSEDRVARRVHRATSTIHHEAHEALEVWHELRIGPIALPAERVLECEGGRARTVA